ncbi:MAG TPA: twin-arginine translocase TatA/TatE family subunit [Phycisphaerae bacterium]|nr:twin-arginine translocase TatA/TatE family subunit [Phycisphaerae bacterium]
MTTLAWIPGWGELLVIGIVAVLIFGRRLPDVGRSLGQGLVEFKKGLKGVQDDVKSAGGEPDETADKTKHNDA